MYYGSLTVQYALILGFALFVSFGMTLVVTKSTKGHLLYRAPYGRKLVFSLFIILFLLYTCFRQITLFPDNSYISGGGYDTIVYKNLFENAHGNIITYLRSYENEPLWLLWCYVVRLFSDKFVIFLITFFLLEFYLQYKICKEFLPEKRFLFFYLTIIVNYVLMSFCIMRATLAIFIFGNGIIALKNKRNVRAWIIGLLAVGIHYSAIIFIPSYLLYYIYKKSRVKTSPYFYVFLCVLCFIFGIFGGVAGRILLQNTRYSSYFEENPYAFGLLIYRLFLLFLIVCNFRRFDLKDRKIVIALSVFATNFMVFGLQLYMHIFYRMYLFADIALLIILPVLLDILKKSKRSSLFNMACYCGVYLMLLYQFVTFYTESVFSYGLLTYKSLL